MNHNTFVRKSFGRIFVEKAEDIDRVKSIIQRMDDFEAQYIPDGLIAVFDPVRMADNNKIVVDLVQVGKFDNLNLNELQMRCWMEGIHILCWRGGMLNAQTETFDFWAAE